MLRDLMKAWWLIHVRGLFTVLFGAFLVFLAGSMRGGLMTAVALVGVMLLFVFYLVVSGLLSIVMTFTAPGGHHRWLAGLTHGTILTALAVWLFFSNQFSLMWLVWFTVANAFGSGVLELGFAYSLRRHIDGLLLTVAGAASVLISAVLVLARNACPASIVLTLGVYAVLYGTVLVILSLRLHSVKQLELVHSA